MGLTINIPFNMKKALVSEWCNFSFGCLSSIKWIFYEVTAAVMELNLFVYAFFDN